MPIGPYGKAPTWWLLLLVGVCAVAYWFSQG
jgi:hypothetical protein